MDNIDRGRRLTLKVVSATLVGIGAILLIPTKPSFGTPPDIPPGQHKKTPTPVPTPTSTPPSGSSFA